jgi:hypothetical protein
MLNSEKLQASPVQTINEQHEQAIISIIQDSIIWNRVAKNMFNIVNAFSPKKQSGLNEFETEYHVEGCINAYRVMGVYNNDDLCEELGDLYWDMLKSEKPANELAQSIYIDWLVCIKNYCATLKTVA